jgi:GTP-binding protein
MMERDNYFGRILTGRIVSGTVRVGDKVHGLRLNGSSGEVVEVGKVSKYEKKFLMLLFSS